MASRAQSLAFSTCLKVQRAANILKINNTDRDAAFIKEHKPSKPARRRTLLIGRHPRDRRLSADCSRRIGLRASWHERYYTTVGMHPDKNRSLARSKDYTKDLMTLKAEKLSNTLHRLLMNMKAICSGPCISALAGLTKR